MQFQQDGGTPHCTKENIQLLNEKINGPVISKKRLRLLYILIKQFDIFNTTEI